MKFESKYGIGEMCSLENTSRRKTGSDFIVKITGVMFNIDGRVAYMGRMDNGLYQSFAECELKGDPEYDQETGYKDDE